MWGRGPAQRKQSLKKEKKEIVLKQQLDTASYLEEQKISAGLHLEIKNKSCLHLEEIK